jgi:hypothetical protein
LCAIVTVEKVLTIGSDGRDSLPGSVCSEGAREERSANGQARGGREALHGGIVGGGDFGLQGSQKKWKWEENEWLEARKHCQMQKRLDNGTKAGLLFPPNQTMIEWKEGKNETGQGEEEKKVSPGSWEMLTDANNDWVSRLVNRSEAGSLTVYVY